MAEHFLLYPSAVYLHEVRNYAEKHSNEATYFLIDTSTWRDDDSDCGVWRLNRKQTADLVFRYAGDAAYLFGPEGRYSNSVKRFMEINNRSSASNESDGAAGTNSDSRSRVGVVMFYGAGYASKLLKTTEGSWAKQWMAEQELKFEPVFVAEEKGVFQKMTSKLFSSSNNVVVSWPPPPIFRQYKCVKDAVATTTTGHDASIREPHACEIEARVAGCEISIIDTSIDVSVRRWFVADGKSTVELNAWKNGGSNARCRRCILAPESVECIKLSLKYGETRIDLEIVRKKRHKSTKRPAAATVDEQSSNDAATVAAVDGLLAPVLALLHDSGKRYSLDEFVDLMPGVETMSTREIFDAIASHRQHAPQFWLALLDAVNVAASTKKQKRPLLQFNDNDDNNDKKTTNDTGRFVTAGDKGSAGGNDSNSSGGIGDDNNDVNNIRDVIKQMAVEKDLVSNTSTNTDTITLPSLASAPSSAAVTLNSANSATIMQTTSVAAVANVNDT